MHTISPPRKVHYKESKETKGINCTGQKDWDGIQICCIHYKFYYICWVIQRKWLGSLHNSADLS